MKGADAMRRPPSRSLLLMQADTGVASRREHDSLVLGEVDDRLTLVVEAFDLSPLGLDAWPHVRGLGAGRQDPVVHGVAARVLERLVGLIADRVRVCRNR